tara:strand:- start:56984 stop:57334 length:351 start_codon:yes stop_codon:yes gene_type:complete
MMFDGLKGMASLAGMMKDLPKMQARMAEVKEHLGDMKLESEVGDGVVRVVVNGAMQLESIVIDEQRISTLEPGQLQDLVRVAINDGLDRAREAVQEKLSSVAGDMGLPLPPGGLGL